MIQSIKNEGHHASSDLLLYHILYCNILYALRRTSDLFSLLRSVSPLSPALSLLQGSYWSLLGQHEEALIAFTDSVKRIADNYDGWLLLGHEYMELHKEKEAVAAYQVATHINNRDYRAFFALAQTYGQGINSDMTYYYLMKAVSLQLGNWEIMIYRPKKSRLWLTLGDYHHNQSDSAKALDAWKRGLKCDELLETREGRLCALRLCSDSMSLCERWLESVIKAKDSSIGLPEAMDIVKHILATYEESQEYHKGEILCSKLLEVFYDVVVN